MPDLNFSIDGAEPVTHAAAPTLALKLKIRNALSSEQIQSVILRCQIQLEVTRRSYSANEQAQLLDLFGEPERWGQTLRNTLWTHVNVNVGPFTGETLVDLPVPCTFDFNVAATKYFHGIEAGDVPLSVLFSGTIFYDAGGRGLQVAQISWSKEARYRLPISVWKGVIDHYYPNTAWLALRRDVFQKLYEYKRANSLTTFEEALERLLAEVPTGVVA